jgi:arginyl-tRNA synthetase
VFDWDKLLAFDGNTAPYIQNAYVRTRAMYRKAGLDAIPQAAVILKEPAELELGKKLIDMADSIEMAGQECRPHLICQYLYDLAALLHRFWEHCPVLKEGVDESTRNSRLVLVGMTGQALKLGLGLLGIETMERM